MEVFVRVVDDGSFAAAGRSLQMSPPSVTRAIASLEVQVGARLLTRTTRRLALTEAGRRYVEDCRRILSDVAEAEAVAAGSFARPTGTLHVTAPVEFGRRHVLPVLGAFLDRHPTVRGRALLLNRVVDLVDEGLDVAVRIGPLPDSSLRAIRVGYVRRVIVAAPAYLAEHGTPEVPQDLIHHDVLAMTSSSASTARWRFAQTHVTVTPRLRCNEVAGVLQCVEAGRGLTRLLSYQVHDALEGDRVHRVLVDHEPPADPVHLVHPQGRQPSAKLRAFLEFAADALRTRLGALTATHDTRRERPPS